jgi:glucan phosphoethanolaminetransferase (alkaline phosphatase superfamily)
LFIAGVYWALMGFMSELFRWGRDTYTNGERLPNHITIPFIFMIVHVILLPILLLWLYKSKNQWSKAHFIVNPMIISGLGASLAASIYWQEKIRTGLEKTHSYIYSEYFYIKITTNVFIVTILIYGLIVWLFKQHLTYPKKK